MQGAEEYADEVYERTMETLENRSRSGEFDIASIEAEYEALTVYQGHGWGGRNAFKDAEIEGQIQAYQIFLHRRKKAAGEE
jgi:hypothetical protein